MHEYKIKHFTLNGLVPFIFQMSTSPLLCIYWAKCCFRFFARIYGSSIHPQFDD